MGSTITEKILANASGVDKVTPGEIITAKVDAVIGHDMEQDQGQYYVSQSGIVVVEGHPSVR